MTETTKGTPPFNTVSGAAANDARAREDDLRALHAASPEEWKAVRLGRYWDGVVTIAVMKPDSLGVDSIEVTADGEPVIIHRGPGLVSGMLRRDARSVEVVADFVHHTIALTDL